MFSVVLFLLFTAAIPHTYALETEFPVDPTSRESFAQPEEMGVSVFAVEPQNKQIVCFDVADEGCIALGLKDPMDPDMGFVSIYTDEGLFLEGFQFKCYGSFYVEVLSNRVNIYCLRGDYLMSIPFTAGACERWSVNNKEVTPFLRILKSANRSRNGIEYKVEKMFHYYTMKTSIPDCRFKNQQENEQLYMMPLSTSIASKPRELCYLFCSLL